MQESNNVENQIFLDRFTCVTDMQEVDEGAQGAPNFTKRFHSVATGWTLSRSKTRVEAPSHKGYSRSRPKDGSQNLVSRHCEKRTDRHPTKDNDQPFPMR